MIEYLLTNAFSLFIRLVLPILVGIGAGGVLSIIAQLMIRAEDKAINFMFRYGGGLIGLYLSIQSNTDLLTQYAKRLWTGVDLYRQ